jgi:FkbM family methyltransferase
MQYVNTILQRGARQLGFDIKRAQIGTSFSRRRHQLMVDHSVEIALDVGASEGLYASELRANGYRGRIVSFEPLPLAVRQLRTRANQDSTWDVIPKALGSSPHDAPLHVSGRHTSSSLLRMTHLHIEASPDSSSVGDEGVRVDRLDDLREELGLKSQPIFLKLDVQGYELEVVRGAPVTLDQVALLEIELSFAELYEGQPLFAECLAVLRSNGLTLVDLESVLYHSATGELLQVNELFSRLVSAASE